ncbi:hypothetical protein [Kitasatospora sp. Root107]|uniref:hypothetical protein n=1 Tax=Kitasatospora sp. Root107 TaxID=1736424 RepID=UPI000A503836|nr:hypothetical protein [Kitasatospora sp. Root107]
MSLLAVLVALAVLGGAAVHASGPVFTVACCAIAAWLAVFAVREQLARTRRH